MSARQVFARHGRQSLAAAPEAPPEVAPLPEPQAERARLSGVAAARRRLVAVAEAEGVPRRYVDRLTDDGVLALAALEDWPLCAAVLALEREAIRAEGFIPAGWRNAAYCRSCGPVWVPADHPAEADACPWCSHTREGRFFLRPEVRCGDCRHYQPNAMNPEAGMGQCSAGRLARKARPPFPFARRVCRFWLHQTPAGGRAPDSAGDDGREVGRASGALRVLPAGDALPGNSDPAGHAHNALPVQLTPGATR